MSQCFCAVLMELMLSHKNKRTKIVNYTSAAAYLLGAFMVLHLGATPDEAWAPFSNLNGAVKAYRDATWVPSPYDLHRLGMLEASRFTDRID